MLIFFFHGCNAEDRCKNVQNDTQIAAAVKSRLQTFQEFLFTRNESTVCDVTENHYNAVYCIAFAAFVLLGVIFTFFGKRPRSSVFSGNFYACLFDRLSTVQVDLVFNWIHSCVFVRILLFLQ